MCTILTSENEFQYSPSLWQIFRGAISSQQETQLGQSRTGSHRVEQIPRTFSSGIDKFVRSSSNPNDRLGRSISNSVDLPAKPEFLPFIASRITQPGPRRQIRICVAFCFLAFCLSTICTGGLAVFIYPTWWLCVVAWIFSAIPVIASYTASLTGKRFWIWMTCITCLINGFVAIAILCVVMTQVSEGVENCKIHLACSEADHQAYIVQHRAIITAVVTLYGISCVVCNGVAMVYSFFLGRKCRRQPANWLTSTTLSKRITARASSAITGPQISVASTSIV